MGDYRQLGGGLKRAQLLSDARILVNGRQAEGYVLEDPTRCPLVAATVFDRQSVVEPGKASSPSRLDSIEREDVKRFILDLRARDFAKNTIRLAVTTLRAALNAAVEDELIEYNPAQGLGRFVKSEKATREATSLKPKEVERLLRAARDELSLADYTLIFTAVRAGLREGEIAALQWGDVQFGEGEEDSDRYIVVQRNYDRRWSRKMLTPKSRRPSASGRPPGRSFCAGER